MLNDKHVQKTISKLRKLDGIYSGLMFVKTGEIPVRFMETDEHLYQIPGDDAAEWKEAGSGLVWGKEWGSSWFKGSYEIPEALHGSKLYIHAGTDGVETLFWVNGKPNGIFTHPKDAAPRGNHHTLLLTQEARAGEVFELAFESYAGHPCVGTQPYQNHESSDGEAPRYKRIFRSIDVMQCREDVRQFVFDLRTLLQLYSSDKVDIFRRKKIQNTLLELFLLLPQSPSEETEEVWRSPLTEACRLMAPLLEKRGGESAPIAGIIGHSHMDTAWLWTIDETIRKCARTYSNVLSLMEQYPEYIFVQSSAYHIELMRRHYPDIFEGIKKRIAEGRWEPNGAVWIESDCNLVSGESLVRQFLKGQRYTREHFGYTADTFWLPDTFGYSAAIPQIMAGAHVKYFLTTKLSWNDTNVFPYDTFYWKGLDGSKVLTHFNTIHCWPDAETVINRIYESHNAIQHKQVNDRRLISYGFGDGGGGPQFEMLEMARRIQDVEGAPRTEHTTVSRFMEGLEESAVHPPVHAGELYFEGHRGTLTQMHQIKRNNRKAEIALRHLELAAVRSWMNGGELMKEEIDRLYEVLLVNQFHDILPGTSIPEVHDRAIREVGQIISEADRLAGELLAGLSANNEDGDAGVAITAWNSLSWQRHGAIAVDGLDDRVHPADESLASQRIHDVFGRSRLLIGGVELPAFGSATIQLSASDAPRNAIPGNSPFHYTGDVLDTPHALIAFDEHGYIASFLDKPSGRELRGSGLPLNAFLFGEDLPAAWDNWDIDKDAIGKLQLQTELTFREVVADGPLQFRIRSHYRIGKGSLIQQDIVFHSDTPRLDFETVIDWNEKHRLLKVSFDVDVMAMNARHETQFGHVERPTHTNSPYDQAMFEVCTHKWTALSENRFGVALLNDCKYGISVEGSDMRLTLHKGGAHPDPRGDQGIHEVTYSFLPYSGSFAAESVIRPAYELNMPVMISSGEANAPAAGASFLRIGASNIIAEAIKPAEEARAYVVRLYEAERSGVKGATVAFGSAPRKVTLVNMLEEELEELLLQSSCMAEANASNQPEQLEVRLNFKPFEIKTIKVYF